MSPTLFRKGSNDMTTQARLAAGRNVGKIVTVRRIQVNADARFQVGEMVALGTVGWRFGAGHRGFFAEFRR